MNKYKLVIVEERSDQPEGTKHPVISYREVCFIGYFKTERELQQWATANLGEIDKA
ncbi:hypothetical protein LCGC14_1974190 [marine sediment metagenome]|uniref:Uncharacterized protein n=1 Tax=marine sediment metagenome TaxID=412755 RepID=A0A0F9HP79_9ZZZZ